MRCVQIVINWSFKSNVGICSEPAEYNAEPLLMGTGTYLDAVDLNDFTGTIQCPEKPPD